MPERPKWEAPVPNPVPDSIEWPDKVDVAIIGAGIAGIGLALELCERGHRVAVFEKGVVAGEQSSRNWGWCRKMGRDPREVPLSKIALSLWEKMDQRLGGKTGFTVSGIGYLCETEKELNQRFEWYNNQAVPNGLSTRMLTSKEVSEFAPGSTVKWAGGMLTPDDGRAEPQLAVPAMAAAVQRLGGMVFQNCAVRGLETAAGQISGVVTERGPVSASTVVLAGGVWSRRFAHNEGIHLPQLGVLNSHMRTETFNAGIETTLILKDAAIRKRADGGYGIAHALYNTGELQPDYFRLLREFAGMAWRERHDYRLKLNRRFFEEARLKRHWKVDEISPFEAVRILDPEPDWRIIREAQSSLAEVLPIFHDVKIASAWAGMIDVVPDIVPVISDVPGRPGLYFSTGYSGHGFGLGPGAAQLMAEIICGEETCVDAAPFRLDRFW